MRCRKSCADGSCSCADDSCPFSNHTRVYALVCLACLLCSFEMLMPVFALAIPEHRCAIPGLENDTFKSQGQWHDDLVNRTVPWSKDRKSFSDCELYETGNASSPGSTNQTRRCNKWVYSKDPFENTFVTEANLVCEDRSMRTYINMVAMAGIMMGSVSLGALADVFGRKTILMLCIAGQIGSGISSAFVSSYIPYAILKFVIVYFNTGTYLTIFVIGIEAFPPEKRAYIGVVPQFFWCFGLFIQSGVAYAIRDWSSLQLALSCPNIIMLSYYFLVPESKRWLTRKQKALEACKDQQPLDMSGLKDKQKAECKVEIRGRGGDTFWHMLSSPVLLIRCLIICFNWIVASMVYDGLSLNVGNLSGNLYLNFFLHAVVELVAYVLCLLLLDRLGRKVLQCTSMIVAGVACISTLFPVIFGSPDTMWITLTLSLIGRLGNAATYVIIYIYAAELFPTVVRSTAMGVCSITESFGGIIAPYIVDIHLVTSYHVGKALPLIIFGGSSILAGLLALLLPETSKKNLPDTIEEAKNFGR